MDSTLFVHDDEHFCSGDYLNFENHDLPRFRLQLSDTLEEMLSPCNDDIHFNTDLPATHLMLPKSFSLLGRDYGVDNEEEISIGEDDLLRSTTPPVEIISVDPNTEFNSPMRLLRSSFSSDSHDSDYDDEIEDNISKVDNVSTHKGTSPPQKLSTSIYSSSSASSSTSASSSSSSSSSCSSSSSSSSDSDSPSDIEEVDHDASTGVTNVNCQIVSPPKTVVPPNQKPIVPTNEYTNVLTSSKNNFSSLLEDAFIKRKPRRQVARKSFSLPHSPNPASLVDTSTNLSYNDAVASSVSRKRICTTAAKLKKPVLSAGDESDIDSDESIDVESFAESEPKHIFERTRTSSKKSSNADPTWTPEITSTATPVAKVRPPRKQKLKAMILTQTAAKPSIRMKILNASAFIAKKAKAPAAVVIEKKTPSTPQIDHDYCSMSKKKSSIGMETKPFSANKQLMQATQITKAIYAATPRSGLPPITANTVKSGTDSSRSGPAVPSSSLGILDCAAHIEIETEKSKPIAPAATVTVQKRKLNFQEYKQRRENSGGLATNTLPHTSSSSPSSSLLSIATQTIKVEPNPALPQIKVAEFATEKLSTPSLMKPHQEQSSVSKLFDPILEAKKKVLRMQELKRAASVKLLDYSIQRKTFPLMPILPMSEITGIKDVDTAKPLDAKLKLNPDYEELIIVSIGCNTIVSIPSQIVRQRRGVTSATANEASSLKSSSSLLFNINNTIEKANVKMSSSSLIASIQDVVLKKSAPWRAGLACAQVSPDIGVSPPSEVSPGKPEMAHHNGQDVTPHKTVAGTAQTGGEHHGEDKIIMHLRKDRIRAQMCSKHVQTESLPEFMPLNELLHTRTSFKSYERNRDRDRDRRRDRHTSHVSSGSDRDHRREESRYRNAKRFNGRQSSHGGGTSARHHRASRSDSRSLSRSPDPANSSSSRGGGGYGRNRRTYSTSSSRSSSKSSVSRSSSRSGCSNRRSQASSSAVAAASRFRSERNKSPEERRIVYVGRLERDLSKDELMRKFISYGPIKQITFHRKDNGTRYGFVTFERAQDAFKAIDTGTRDARINMYDISFGGRRAFCRTIYSDLDGASTNSMSKQSNTTGYAVTSKPCGSDINAAEDDSFDALLKQMKEKIGAQKPRLKF